MRKNFSKWFAVAAGAGLVVLTARSVFAQQSSAGAQQKEDQAHTGVLTPRNQNQDKKDETNQRTIEGLVSDDAKNPVAGAVVQLKDTRTMQIRSFITQIDGTYRFAGLRLDTDYELSAKFSEKASGVKRVSSFESRKTVVVNLPLDKTEKK
jgi:hypothetical protein